MIINCTHCGQKLIEGNVGNNIVVKCSRCKKFSSVSFEKGEVRISIKEKMQPEVNKQNSIH